MIRERIKKLLDDKCKGSPEQFSEMTNIGVSTLGTWDDEHVPSGRFLMVMQRVFGVSIDWLFTGSGEPYIIKDKWENAVVMERKEGYVGSQSKDPLKAAVDGVFDIFKRGDDSIRSAIVANINAFSSLNDIRDRLDRIESLLKEFTAQHVPPDGIEERRRAWIEMKKAIGLE